jgi:hypothetical protein
VFYITTPVGGMQGGWQARRFSLLREAVGIVGVGGQRKRAVGLDGRGDEVYNGSRKLTLL